MVRIAFQHGGQQATGFSRSAETKMRLRMHRASQLLDTTPLSVKAVATALGYEDPLYFSRVFRSVNKVSPKAYRQMLKG